MIILFAAGTTCLICSDGVNSHIGDPEIRDILASGAEPPEIASQIRALCYERGAEDNLTAVLVKAAPTGTRQAERPFVPSANFEEPILATPPSAFESKIADEWDDDELLELQTRELRMPADAERKPEPVEAHGEQAAWVEPEAFEKPIVPAAPAVGPATSAEPVSPFEEEAEPEASAESRATRTEAAQIEDFSLFGDSGSGIQEKKEKGSFAKILSAAGLLLLGGIIGLAAYNFFLVPLKKQTDASQIYEMRSS